MQIVLFQLIEIETCIFFLCFSSFILPLWPWWESGWRIPPHSSLVKLPVRTYTTWMFISHQPQVAAMKQCLSHTYFAVLKTHLNRSLPPEFRLEEEFFFAFFLWQFFYILIMTFTFSSLVTSLAPFSGWDFKFL